MALNTEAIKNKQPERPEAKGFGGPRPSGEPSRPQSSPVETVAITRPSELKGSAKTGLANAATAEAQKMAGQIQVAEEFSAKAGEALAERAHRVATGEVMLESFMQRMNQLCQATPDAAETPVVEDLDSFLSELGKPSYSLPSVKPQFFLKPSN